MPITKKVRDIMVPLSDYAVTNVKSSLKEAALSLRKQYCQVEEGRCTEAGHRSVLVLDDSGALVGVLDFRSVLRVLIPEIAGGLTVRLESLGVSAAFAEAGAFELDESRLDFYGRVRKNAETRVSEVMLKVRGTIDAEADLMEALRLIYQNKVHMLPVFDAGKLVGVVRDSDLFLVVADIFRT